jgi:hypothetical protein
VPLRLEDDAVVQVPVVGTVVRIGAVERLPLRHTDPTAPVQVDAQQVDAELLELREEVGRLPVVGAAAVGDPAAQPGCGRGRRRAQECQHRRCGRPGEPAPHALSIGSCCAEAKGIS